MERYRRKFVSQFKNELKENPEGLKILSQLGYNFKISDIKKAVKSSSSSQYIDLLYTSGDQSYAVSYLIGIAKAIKEGRDPEKGGYGVILSVVRDLEKINFSASDLQSLKSLFLQFVKNY